MHEYKIIVTSEIENKNIVNLESENIYIANNIKDAMLKRIKTLPMGNIQWYNDYSCLIIVKYNTYSKFYFIDGYYI